LIGPAARVFARIHDGTLSPANPADLAFAKVRQPCCGLILILISTRSARRSASSSQAALA
jgi:hypothetical protein